MSRNLRQRMSDLDALLLPTMAEMDGYREIALEALAALETASSRIAEFERATRYLTRPVSGPWHNLVNRHPTTDGQPWGCLERIRHPAMGAGVPLFPGGRWTGLERKQDAEAIVGLHAFWRARDVLLGGDAAREG